MREIKFRARWKDTGEIIPEFSEEYLIDACNDDVFIVDQFTGLKDKNGKDIYEGDILLSKMFDNRIDEWVKRKCKVIPLEDGCFKVSGTKGNKYWNPLLTNIIEDDWTVEVIDNIYENPELLRGNSNE